VRRGIGGENVKKIMGTKKNWFFNLGLKTNSLPIRHERNEEGQGKRESGDQITAEPDVRSGEKDNKKGGEGFIVNYRTSSLGLASKNIKGCTWCTKIPGEKDKV